MTHRCIVYGLGAIGGTVAGYLAIAGIEVAGVARGANLAKIRARHPSAAGGGANCSSTSGTPPRRRS